MKPRLLDLFCGAGGAAVGYHRAGFEVVGVDISPQPRYPFEFVQADALEFVGGLSPFPRPALESSEKGLVPDREIPDAPAWGGFDAIHASPPCQSYSRALRHMSLPQPELISEAQELLDATGLPYVIENVPGAPLPRADTLDGRYGLELCGTQFGLLIARHRLFEMSFPMVAPHRSCTCSERNVLNPYNAKTRQRMVGDAKGDMAEIVWRAEMGVPWMNRYEGREAVPPAYTEFIGHQLMQHVRPKSLSGGIFGYSDTRNEARSTR